MKKISSPLLVMSAALLATLVYQSALCKTNAFVNYRLKSIDTLFAWRARSVPPSKHLKDIVIISVDDDSYRRMDRAWPWDRSVYAVCLDNLQKLNPKVVGFDFTFVGKSQTTPIDQTFAESIGEKKNVVLACYFDQENLLMRPLDMFLDRALGYGFIDKPYDRDGVNRRTKIVIPSNADHEDMFSIATWLAYTYWGLEPTGHLELQEGHMQWQRPKNNDPEDLETIEIPVDLQGCQWISYRYRLSNFQNIPFWKLFTGQVSRDEIQGKIVVLGSVSALFHDIHPTPLGLMPGVTIIANEILSILDKDFIQTVPASTQRLLWIVLTLCFAWVFYRLDFVKSFLVLILSEVLIHAGVFILFSRKNMLLDPFSPMFLVGTCYFIAVFYKSSRIFFENMALQKVVITDSLTGLYGHRYLSFRLETEFKRHQESKSSFCFAMIDVDLFKRVNDTYGHEVGNTVLVSLAKLLKNGVRGYDLAARYGGEEFALILFRLEEEAAFQIIERIRLSIADQKFYSPKGEFHVTMSAGVCLNRNPDVKSKDDLIRFADQALYQAKAKGRNQTCLYKAKTGTPLVSKNP